MVRLTTYGTAVQGDISVRDGFLHCHGAPCAKVWSDDNMQKMSSRRANILEAPQYKFLKRSLRALRGRELRPVVLRNEPKYTKGLGCLRDVGSLAW
jgi:hypothetical protein